ncbi:MAG: hypothetical protein DRJ32_01105 [Thermoprotei archaeon]|nr:MAG: hypothetical protein DRJ32_01105 [Thermoprotei archaeon]
MISRCEICDSFTKDVYICKLCGRKVCKEHYDETKSICLVCAVTLCQLCGKRLARGNCAVCGKLVCSACSIKVGAGLVCKRCLQTGQK